MKLYILFVPALIFLSSISFAQNSTINVNDLSVIEKVKNETDLNNYKEFTYKLNNNIGLLTIVNNKNGKEHSYIYNRTTKSQFNVGDTILITDAIENHYYGIVKDKTDETIMLTINNKDIRLNVNRYKYILKEKDKG